MVSWGMVSSESPSALGWFSRTVFRILHASFFFGIMILPISKGVQKETLYASVRRSLLDHRRSLNSSTMCPLVVVLLLASTLGLPRVEAQYEVSPDQAPTLVFTSPNSDGKLQWSSFDISTSTFSDLGVFGQSGWFPVLASWKTPGQRVRALLRKSKLSQYLILIDGIKEELSLGMWPGQAVAQIGRDSNSNGIADALLVVTRNHKLSWRLIFDPLVEERSFARILYGQTSDIPFLFRARSTRDSLAILRRKKIMYRGLGSSLQRTIRLSGIRPIAAPRTLRNGKGQDSLLFEIETAEGTTILTVAGRDRKEYRFSRVGTLVVGDFWGANEESFGIFDHYGTLELDNGTLLQIDIPGIPVSREIRETLESNVIYPTALPTPSLAAVTPTVEKSPTPIAVQTNLPSPAPSLSYTDVPTQTPFPTYTNFPTLTPLPTYTFFPTFTSTATATPTATPTSTSTPTATFSAFPAYAWGNDSAQQLGDGDPDTATDGIPKIVAGNLAFRVIASSGRSPARGRSCALTANGVAYCWGESGSALGTSDTSTKHTPTQVQGGLLFRDITLGRSHTCALDFNGTAYCWGNDDTQQLGNGNPDTGSLTAPFPVAGNHQFVQIDAGAQHTCALKATSEVYCWGSDSQQQLGNGNSDTSDVDTPTLVTGGLSFSHISAGTLHTCGVTTTNQAYCWGSDGSGELGNGAALTGAQSTPTLVLGGILFTKVYTFSAGSEPCSCGISTTGMAYCWGSNWNSQLGSSGGSSNTPRAVLGTLTFQELAMGDDHTCGITTNRDMYCWGGDGAQQLGDGNSDTSNDPVPGLVTGGLKFRAVSAGNSFTVGLVE